MSPHVTLVAAVLALHATQSQPSSNFQFVWQYAHCYQLYRLDTRDRTFTRQRLSGEVDGTTKERPVSVPLELRVEEREKVFAEMLRIGFFDFPTEITYPPDAQVVTVTPPSRFRLEALGQMMQGFIDSRQAPRRMPGRVLGCE